MLVAWSESVTSGTTDEFLRSHHGLEDWQIRVLREKEELDGRRSKLDVYLTAGAAGASAAERTVLGQQYSAMTSYSRCLGQRICLWQGMEVSSEES